MKKQIISMILVLCMLMSMMPVSVFATTDGVVAQTATTESVTSNIESDTKSTDAEPLWEYTEVEGGVELTAYKGTATDIYVPSVIEVDGENLSVISLADGIFNNNDALNSVTLGKGILKIGDEAFYDCDNMVCILISEELTTIGDRAFYSCDNFNSVILYDTVESIGTDAFAQCPKLTVWCNDGTAGYAYATENNIPVEILNPDAEPELHEIDGVKYYVMNGQAYAVECDTAVTEVVVPATVCGFPVTELRSTFIECRKLTTVNLPNSLRVIGDYAFYWCEKLSSVNIPSGVSVIGQRAFMYCIVLRSVELPLGITEISDYAFFNSGLLSVTLHENITKIGKNSFYGSGRLEYINLPESIVEIGVGAFRFCRSLKEITIPGSISTIGEDTFSGCESLTKLVIKNGVKKIDLYAFENCISLSEVNIPNSVNHIGFQSFMGCEKIRHVIIPKNAYVYYNAFCPSTVLLVYENSSAHNTAKNNNLLFMIYDGVNMPEIYERDGVVYCIIDGKAVAVYFLNTSTSVVIPQTIEGYPVTELRGTFCNNSNITSVTLPYGLEIIGDKTFQNCTKLESVNVPDTVTEIRQYAFNNCKVLKSVNIPNGITKISFHSFEASGLTSVVIPDTVKTIESYGFGSCKSLKSVVVSKNLELMVGDTFAYCESLEEIVLPDSLTYVGSYSFYRCTKLRNVTIGKNTKKLQRYAFGECTSLTEIALPDGLTTIEDKCFDGCYNLLEIALPQSVSSISSIALDLVTVFDVYENSYAHKFAKDNGYMYHLRDSGNEPEFIEDSGLTYYIFNGEAIVVNSDKTILSFNIPKTINGYPVTTINGAFRYARTLKTLVLPDGLTTICNDAFYCCNDLSSINIPDTVTEIRDNSFGYTRALSSVKLSENLTEISDYAFENSGLTNIEFPENIKSIGKRGFYLGYLKSLYIPDTITSIGEEAFMYNYKLNDVVVSGSVNKIPDYAFRGCYNLQKVVLKEGVQTIGMYAFDGCDVLKEVIIPSTVTSIASQAFTDCPKLRMVYLSENVKKLYDDSFYSSTILLVHENSYAHNFAKNNDLLYFVLHKTENPLINYGTSLSGVVTYTDGSVASKATVEILSDDGTVKETVVADANGAYASTYAEVGDYIIRATDAQGNTATTQASVKRMNIFEVFVTGDTNPVLKKSYSVSGTVNEGGATVTITDEKGNIIDSVVADENGNFSFSDIPNGTYVVTAKGENGSVSQEVTVFDADVSDLNLEIIPESVTIWGLVEVEDRKGDKAIRNWVDVTIYNSDGVVVDKCKTDSDGKYRFENLSIGEYSIVAETFEMREDKHHGYDRIHKLTGYSYVNITETGEHQAETIVLKEEKEELSTFEGKVTANGETQDCQVILRDSNRNEIAKVTTKKNGKFSFSNICDGVYYILAITKSDGMGYTVVTIKDGVVYGDLHVRVYKSDKVQRREAEFEHDVPTCHTREDALKHKDRIAEEKRFYDGLSEKEKKQLSEFYVERLNKLAEWITNVSYETPENVVIEQGGLVVSGNEIENESEIIFNLNIESVDSWQANENGIETEDDYIYHDVKSAANTQEIKQYYEITMTKTIDGEEKEITSVRKDTDAMGVFRITMPIPEEYRGHKHYSMVHVHNGETIMLTDLDDNPDTITVEVSEFSTFVLTATDTVYSSVVYSLGDTDLDGEVTIMDTTRLQMYLAEKTELEGKQIELADTTKDSVISIMDATMIQMFIAQLIETL